MANETVNYKLIKPTENEFYNIEVQNDNMDLIDAALKAKASTAEVEVVNESLTALETQTQLLAMSGKLSTYRTGKDADGIFTTITYNRKDGTLYQTSVLSGGTAPKYTTRTVQYYDATGAAIPSQLFVMVLTYDTDGVFISEVVS